MLACESESHMLPPMSGFQSPILEFWRGSVRQTKGVEIASCRKGGKMRFLGHDMKY